MSNDNFVPHKNAPGPPRLEMAVEMAVADNSGSVNPDPTFMADRLAITMTWIGLDVHARSVHAALHPRRRKEGSERS